jgi:soluble lytic murein transglycosylase
MLKQQKSIISNKKWTNSIYLLLGSGLVLLASVCLVGLVFRGVDRFEEWKSTAAEEELNNNNSQVLSSAFRSPQQRESHLKAIASGKKDSENISSGLKYLDRARARYMLAGDLLQQNQLRAALQELDDLEKEYTTLAPHILLKRAEVYQSLKQIDRAKQIWQQIITEYPDSGAIAQALYQLGYFNPQRWDDLVTRYPYSPYAQAIARQRLQKNPDRVDALVLLARYNQEEDTTALKDRLVLEYSDKLKPEDWESIAFGYWQNKEYRKAADAYLLARLTPRNLYRAARGFEQNGNKQQAIDTYQKLLREFHDAREAGSALLRLASLSSGREAIAYLDLVIKKFPTQSPDALHSKVIILKALGKNAEATQTEQQLLQNYGNSEAAVQYRWNLAQKLAAKKDLANAWQWLQPIIESDAKSDLLPEISFWAGKYALQLDRKQDAKAAFANAIARSPESYYAWRSAVFLGLPVGDFTTLRQMTPKIELPSTRSIPLAGSETFKELFRLGQDRDAWNLFLAELGDRQMPSINEQFTEGSMLIARGKPRKGILLIRDLRNRDSSQEKLQLQELRQTPEYWLTLFPFPFQKYILDSSKQNQINSLLTVSLIRQESSFETKIDSTVGAAGLMQLMPDTASWIAEQIKFEKYVLEQPEDNIKIGTAYLAYLHGIYKNNSLLTVASYNAGGQNVSKWVEKHSLKDPDILVENIPFPETKDYVESVFGNYWNYQRMYNPEVSGLLSQYQKKREK